MKRFIEINRSIGLYRVGRLFALISKGYATLAIAGIVSINLSSANGTMVAVRLRSKDRTTTRWLNISRAGKSVLTLPRTARS